MTQVPESAPVPGDGGLVAHGGPHVFVSDLEPLELDPDDHHHLSRVLRLRAGERLTASDGRGRWRSCRFGPALEPNGDVITTASPSRPLAIGFALVKGSKPELVVQKLTELGVDRIQPFAAARSVVKWDDARAQRNLVRLRRVAREAAMQSHRAWIAQVEPVASFSDLAAISGVVRADMEGALPTGEERLVLIGPEGGWTDAERAEVPPAVSVGPHVMRAETAAIAVASVLAALRCGAIGPASSR